MRVRGKGGDEQIGLAFGGDHDDVIANLGVLAFHQARVAAFDSDAGAIASYIGIVPGLNRALGPALSQMLARLDNLTPAERRRMITLVPTGTRS